MTGGTRACQSSADNCSEKNAAVSPSARNGEVVLAVTNGLNLREFLRSRAANVPRGGRLRRTCFAEGGARAAPMNKARTPSSQTARCSSNGGVAGAALTRLPT